MYNVKFPGFGLSFKINPVAFSIGDFEVRWYGIIIAMGFVLAFIYVAHECKRFRISFDRLTDAIITGLITGIIGARLYYVLFFPGDTYKNNPLEIFNIHQGGIAIYGGIIGGLLGGILVARKKKLPILSCLDIASIGFLIGQAIGRWGNFTNQEAFGIKTDSIFRMVSENTEGVGVHPCFLYESMWCLLGVGLLHFFNTKCKSFDGQTFLLYLIWYGAERFFVESLRTDSLMLPILSLRVSQVVALLTIVTSLFIIIMVYRKNRRFNLENN